MSESLRVAAVQMALRPERSLDAWAEHVGKLVAEAAAQDVALVVLPEMSTTGLLATHPDAHALRAADMNAAYRAVLPPLTTAVRDILISLAREHGLAICGGSHWRGCDDGGYRNTAYLAQPDGSLHSQDKLHLTWPEEQLGTDRGDWIEPVRVGPANVAIQICADIEFPELTRAMALKGAEVILCPSLTWNSRGRHRVRYSCLARSVEHQVFVVMAPMVGTDGIPAGAALHARGNALITVPLDRSFGIADGVLAETSEDGEAMVVADLDLELLHEMRASSDTPGLRHGRPELYQRLMADAMAVAHKDDT
jgi:predicted amidohydrolase